MTAFSLLGIALTRFWRTVTEIDFQALWKTALECFQCLWLRISIDCCGHNAPNVFNWRQIWQILGQSSWGIYCPVFLSSQVIVAVDVCARAPSCWNNPSQLCKIIHHNCEKSALSNISQVSADLHAAECRLDFFLEYFTDVVIGIYRSFLWMIWSFVRPLAVIPPHTIKDGLNFTCGARGMECS